MYKNILATLATLSVMGIFAVLAVGMHEKYEMHDGKNEMHEQNEKNDMHDMMEKSSDHASSEEHMAMEARVAELETALEQLAMGTNQSFKGLDNLSFFLEKVVDKNYTPEEKEALIAEYQELLKQREAEIQKQAESAQQNTPAVPAAE